MVVVILNLNVNWARLLLYLLKEETKPIIEEAKDDMMAGLTVKRPLYPYTKISFMILKRYQRSSWKGSLPFDRTIGHA